jgi:hypothetical protein
MFGRVVTTILLVPALIMASPSPALASGLTVISPAASSAQTGKTYGELSAAWWQTMLPIPVESNPTFDSTGVNCQSGETPKIFFLAGEGSGNPVTRTCKVPSTKPLFFPIINVECSNVENPPFFGATDADRKACAQGFADEIGLSTLRLTLDGVAIGNLARFRAASPPFSFTMPRNDNILFVQGKTSGRSVSDGYWALLEPPAPGNHVIHFEGAFVSGPGAGFSQNVTYQLSVQ